jgi:hypothetical protein
MWRDQLSCPCFLLCLLTFFIAEDVVETQLLKYVGTLTRQNFLNVHRAYHAILLKHGVDQETLDEWSRHTDEGQWNQSFVSAMSYAQLILSKN